MAMSVHLARPGWKDTGPRKIRIPNSEELDGEAFVFFEGCFYFEELI